MAKTVNALEVRKRLGEVINEVLYKGQRFLIERRGTPVAAIVPVAELEELERRENSLLALIEEETRRAAEASSDTIERRVRERLGIEAEYQVSEAVEAAARRKSLAVYERIKERAKEIPEEILASAIEEAVSVTRKP